MKKLVYSLASAGALVVVGACGSQGGSVAAPAKRATAQKTAQAVAPAAATATGPAFTYTYNPMGKRDPFRVPMEDVRQAEVASVCEAPLCQWDLDQLKLVAVVTGDANPIAMVQDPAGRGHVVRRNTRIGRQGGRVTQILRNSVTVTEYMSGVDGKIIANPVALALSEGDEKDRSAAYDLLTGRNFGE